MTVRLIEGQVPYTGGTAIEITADKVINLLLRSEDNLLQVNDDNELYCDLQLANGLAPTDDFPVGITTGIVNANDGRPYNGLLLHYETTSGAYAQWLYAGDGHFYLDGGTGTFKKIYYADEVDALFQQLVDMIGDGILTIQKNGTTVGTFTANQSNDTTINITVPTKLSDLQNDVVNDGKLTIKRNNTTIAEFTANDATNVYADINVPELTNNTTTPSSTTALTAAMGKELQDQINNINSIGRFLSLWNCATGLPQTNPPTSPYMYHTGDYYVVGYIDATTNYKPDGGSYTTGVASTTVETLTVGVGDMYFYDGTTWTLKKFTGQTFPIDNVLSTTSTNAVENRVITTKLLNDLNTKAFYLSGATDLTTAQAIYDWINDGNYPLLIFASECFFLDSSGTSSMTFLSYKKVTGVNNQSMTYFAWREIEFALTNGQVTAITTDVKYEYFLETGVDYVVPYTPQYNGSPATKKYVDDKQISISVTLAAANWSGNSITVTATGVTSSNTVILSPDPSSISDYAENSVYCSAQGTNTLTFTCDTVPTNDLTVNVVILN